MGGRQLPLHAQPPPGLSALPLPLSLWGSQVQPPAGAWRDGHGKITHMKGTWGEREGPIERGEADTSSVFMFNKKTDRIRRGGKTTRGETVLEEISHFFRMRFESR